MAEKKAFSLLSACLGMSWVLARIFRALMLRFNKKYKVLSNEKKRTVDIHCMNVVIRIALAFLISRQFVEINFLKQPINWEVWQVAVALVLGMYSTEVIYRTKMDMFALAHHAGAIFTLTVFYDYQPDRFMIVGSIQMFTVAALFPIWIPLIMYRVDPNMDRNSKLFFVGGIYYCIVELFGQIYMMITIVELWNELAQTYRIMIYLLPILLVDQYYVAYVFYVIYQKCRRKNEILETARLISKEIRERFSIRAREQPDEIVRKHTGIRVHFNTTPQRPTFATLRRKYFHDHNSDSSGDESAGARTPRTPIARTPDARYSIPTNVTRVYKRRFTTTELHTESPNVSRPPSAKSSRSGSIESIHTTFSFQSSILDPSEVTLMTQRIQNESTGGAGRPERPRVRLELPPVFVPAVSEISFSSTCSMSKASVPVSEDSFTRSTYTEDERGASCTISRSDTTDGRLHRRHSQESLNTSLRARGSVSNSNAPMLKPAFSSSSSEMGGEKNGEKVGENMILRSKPDLVLRIREESRSGRRNSV